MYRISSGRGVGAATVRELRRRSYGVTAADARGTGPALASVNYPGNRDDLTGVVSTDQNASCRRYATRVRLTTRPAVEATPDRFGRLARPMSPRARRR